MAAFDLRLFATSMYHMHPLARSRKFVLERCMVLEEHSIRVEKTVSKLLNTCKRKEKRFEKK